MSLSDKTFAFSRLKGQENYEIWALRMESYLIEKNLYNSLDNELDENTKRALAAIRLALEDGPLLQIQGTQNAKQAWEMLKSLYSSKGFNSEFLTCKELFQTTLENSNNMESYLNTIKRLYDQLKAKGIEIPKQVIIAWTLNNLTDEYNGFVTTISQAYRTNKDAYSLESLFSNLLDESRRYNANESQSLALWIRDNKFHKKEKRNIKRLGGEKGPKLYCAYCNKEGHREANCYNRYPNKAPKWWKPTRPENQNKREREENEEALFAAKYKDDRDLDLDRDISDVEEVLISNTVSSPKADFVLDSGATRHIFNKREYFINSLFVNKPTEIRWANAGVITSYGEGSVKVRFNDTNKVVLLERCLFVPEFTLNIVSLAQLDSKGVYAQLKTGKIELLLGDKGPLTKALRKKSLYCLDISVRNSGVNNTSKRGSEAEKAFIAQEIITKSEIWHKRLGHIGPKVLETLGLKGCQNCEVCLEANKTRKISHKATTKANAFLDKTSCDICGPIEPKTREGYYYFISFIDNWSRYIEAELITNKSSAYNAISSYKSRAENAFSNAQKRPRMKVFKSDNAKELTSTKVKELFTKEGVLQETSTPYAPEQNGLIERPNRTLLNKVRAMLLEANLPKWLWGEALKTAVYLYNITPHSSLEYKSPYEYKYNKKPDYSIIRIFGSIAYYRHYKLKKLDSRARKAILVGFGQNQYKLLDLESKKLVWARDVTILEGHYLTSSKEALIAPKDDYSTLEMPISENKKARQEAEETSEIGAASPITSSTPESEITELRQDLKGVSRQLLDPTQQLQNEMQVTQTLVDDGEEDELALLANASNLEDPITYKDVLELPNKEDWFKSMQNEMDDLSKLRTWTLVELPKGRTVLKGRWVFKTKRDPYGNLIKLKSRWVAKGFKQVEGLDFDQTFSCTCRPETWRALFYKAAHLNWEIEQWDVKLAFPNSPIDKEIYIEQPHGFIDLDNPNKVCKLNTALYGLKQAARQWYKHLASILSKYGFEILPKDNGAFLNKEAGIIIACHVDDMLIFGPQLKDINTLKQNLLKHIEVSDLGHVKHYLGIEILRDRENKIIKLSQQGYLEKILKKYTKKGLNPVSTPAEVGIRLEANKSETADLANIKEYQKEVGALIYLATKTRPDITYAVGQCAKYMSNPDQSHFRALNRIWKYLNSTQDKCLVYNAQSAPLLNGYCDADWGGDYTTRRSTTGYIFFLGNKAPISWRSTLQKTVALSSCEAEYMALKSSVQESLFLRDVCASLDIDFGHNTIRTDNQAAIQLANNPEHHNKTKHIDIQYHFIRECLEDKRITIQHIPTKKQIADLFTKALDTYKFKGLIEQII